MQVAVASPEARLVVLEAETGSGKTEAALWRFAQLFAHGDVDGVYFALPTRVAATQIHARVRGFRDGQFGPHGPAVVRAVPGQVAAVSHGCPAALFRGVNILNTKNEAGR